MKIQITEINVTFSNGSFADFANMFGEQNEEDVTRWEQQYNEEIIKAIMAVYPHANVEVEEGYEQLAHTKFYVDCQEVELDEDYEEDDYFYIHGDVIETVTAVIDEVTNKGNFWA